MSLSSPHRRRLLSQVLSKGLAGVPLVVTAIQHPVLAGTPQTASAYGSIVTSARPSQPSYYSNPFSLTEALNELEAAMEAEANRLSKKNCGGLLGGLLCVVTSLLNALLSLIGGLFNGTSTAAQVQSQSPELYTFMTNYRSAKWPISPTAAFGTAISPLGSYTSKPLIDVATKTSDSLGRYFVAAILNTTASGRIDPTLLTSTRVKTIAQELNLKGTFEPTAGVQWNSAKVMEWWQVSLGMRL